MDNYPVDYLVFIIQYLSLKIGCFINYFSSFCPTATIVFRKAIPYILCRLNAPARTIAITAQSVAVSAIGFVATALTACSSLGTQHNGNK